MNQADNSQRAQTDAVADDSGNEQSRPPTHPQAPQSNLDKVKVTIASAVRGLTFPAQHFPIQSVVAMPKWRKRDESLADSGDIDVGNQSGCIDGARAAAWGDAAVRLRNASPRVRETAPGVVQQVRALASQPVLRSGEAQRCRWLILFGVAVIDVLFKPKNTPKDEGGRDAKSSAQQDKDASGDRDNAAQGIPDPAAIPGIGDRRSDLAMTALSGTPRLRPAQLRKESTVTALRPQSRLECGRRCGHNGFCDPSNPLGCGGIYCAQQGASKA